MKSMSDYVQSHLLGRATAGSVYNVGHHYYLLYRLKHRHHYTSLQVSMRILNYEFYIHINFKLLIFNFHVIPNYIFIQVPL